MVLATSLAGSKVGHPAVITDSVPPRRAHSSSARWGAKGASKRSTSRSTARGRAGSFCSAFKRIIIWEIAVLKRRLSISSPTFLIVSCRNFSASGVSAAAEFKRGLSPPSSLRHSRQTLRRNRCTPSMPWGFHGFIASSGPKNIRYIRSESAP